VRTPSSSINRSTHAVSSGDKITRLRRFLLLPLVVLALALLIGCEEESLRVQPGDVTLIANQSVAFTAALFGANSKSRTLPKVSWQAKNVATGQATAISSHGVFTAHVSGQFQITARAAHAVGRATVRVLPDVTQDAKELPSQTISVSSRPDLGPPPPSSQQGPFVARGWSDTTFRQAFEIQNRRGHDPTRRRQNFKLTSNEDVGSGNYLLAVPVLNLPGRGMGISLNLFYNSKVWTRIAGPGRPAYYMVFDQDNGWPAPGWSLGFGKVVQMGSTAGGIEDADGTLHQFQGNSYYGRTNLSHTTDGTLFDYTFNSDGRGNLNAGAVHYPNGKTVTYGAPNTASGVRAIYPTTITDANGNFISISYRNNQGPAIGSIVDTLGRVIEFHYDSNNLLTAITAPGLGEGTRTLVRLHYSQQQAQFAFKSTIATPIMPDPGNPSTQNAIDGIYFPGSSTGYWFGDSYSNYGMIQRVSQRRGMTLQANSLTEQGTLTAGTMTRQREYNYPGGLDYALTDAPTYTQMTETWAGMDVPPAVTTYKTQMDANPREIDTVAPDGTRVTQLVYNHPNQYDDGLLYQTTTYDVSGNQKRQVTTSWEGGDYDSPRIASSKATDQLGQTTTTVYGYRSRWQYPAGIPATNQVISVQQLDYDGKTVLREIDTDYELGTGYPLRHIFNLPKVVITRGSGGAVAARTEYSYDQQPLKDTPNVIGAFQDFNPYTAVGPLRGNVTQITRYKNAAAAAGPIVETRGYDITGNLVSTSGSCCEQTSISYALDTQYAYPFSVTRGAADPNSPLHVTQSFTYDFNTGRVTSSTDPNGLTTRTSYDAATLRPQEVTFPTSAFVDYTYDDAGMSATQTTYTPPSASCVVQHPIPARTIVATVGTVASPCQPALASQTVTRVNGLGEAQRVETLTEGHIWNAVSEKYDVLGRVWQRSQPYQLSQAAPTLWTVFSYDALGRMTSVQNPDGSQTKSFYNEPSRPSSASKAGGQTLRVLPPYGGDRWIRTNALGQLAEVVEPPAYVAGSLGSVAVDGNVDTAYSYNGLGELVHVDQGLDHQTRDFQYDSLGRLVAQHLAEKEATLDTAGAYVGAGGHWSDVFAYDDRSNLVLRTDARGVRTVYEYAGDPLDRLQGIQYKSTHPDASVLPTLPVTYQYMATGDVTRPFQVAMLQGTQKWGVQEFGYDSFARLASKKLTYPGNPTLELDYDSYDTLNRLLEMTYPAELEIPSQPRKKVDYSYGVGGQLTGLQVDGADYASQLAYNPAGQTTSITVGPSGAQRTTEAYSYDPATEFLGSQQVQRGSTSLLSITYQYYANGQLKQLMENGSPSHEYDYIYDALGRLRNMKKAAGPDSPEWSESYAFDSYGNRTTVCATGQVSGSAVPPDGLPSLAYDTKSNRVSTAGFSYDAAGNQTRSQRADGSWLRYQYDQVGRLANVTDDVGKLLESYKYGPDGKRLISANASESTYYLWDRNSVIAEYKQKATDPKLVWSRSKVYIGSRILATFNHGQSGDLVYYHHPDRLGTRLVTNSADGIANEQTTLPFGTLFPNQSSDPVNPIFTSYDRSSKTGLDYAVNRQFDPQQRFTQVDPAGMSAVSTSNPQSLNLYSYAGNDPVNRTDSLGLTLKDQPYMYPCPASEMSCPGEGAEGTSGWGAGGGGGGTFDSFVGVSGERWYWICGDGSCGLYPSHILESDAKTLLAIYQVSNFYANGGTYPSAALEWLSFALSPEQLKQVMYGILESNASPSQLNTKVGMLAGDDYYYGWMTYPVKALGMAGGGLNVLKYSKYLAAVEADPALGYVAAAAAGLAYGYALDKSFEWGSGGYMPADFIYFAINGRPNAGIQWQVTPSWGLDLTDVTAGQVTPTWGLDLTNVTADPASGAPTPP
jgi:RHS repeat-associated protein